MADYDQPAFSAWSLVSVPVAGNVYRDDWELPNVDASYAAAYNLTPAIVLSSGAPAASTSAHPLFG